MDAKIAWRLRGPTVLAGRVEAPPDKSVTHRALILAALGRGRARIENLGLGEDNRATVHALRALGVTIKVDPGRRLAEVEGVEHPGELRPPAHPIDCGNSGTTMRLLTGVLAASGHRVTLTGDESLRRRPMSRLRPLEAMGARLEGREVDGRLYPPLVVQGKRPPRAIDADLPVASAQVKSAILLNGLFASGTVRVTEPAVSRDHTERMLLSLGVTLSSKASTVVLEPRRQPWTNARFRVPPDASSAAFLVAASVLTGGRIAVKTGLNPTRGGFFDVLSAMSAELESTAVDVERRPGEPVGWVTGRAPTGLSGTEIGGALTLRAIDEIPLIAGLAGFARGETVIRDAAELRVKESDRLRGMHEILRGFGIRSTETPGGLTIRGGRPRGAKVDTFGDHRLAMTATVMALAAEGTSYVRGVECIAVSYPELKDTLASLGVEVEEEAVA